MKQNKKKTTKTEQRSTTWVKGVNAHFAVSLHRSTQYCFSNVQRPID